MKITMYLLIAGCVVNIILDPILIFGLLGFPALGVAGAAIATVIGQISALLLYIIVYRRNSYAVPSASSILSLIKRSSDKFTVSESLYCYDALPSILISVLNSILTAFSDVYVAVLGVYFKLQTFIYMPANGIVQGMRPIIGYNYAAVKVPRQINNTIQPAHCGRIDVDRNDPRFCPSETDSRSVRCRRRFNERRSHCSSHDQPRISCFFCRSDLFRRI